jgi:hypothetical protein
MGKGHAQIEALIDLDQGLFMPALLDQHGAQIDVRISKRRIQFDRLVEIGPRIVRASQPIQQDAAIVVSARPVLPVQSVIGQRCVANRQAGARLIPSLGMNETGMGRGRPPGSRSPGPGRFAQVAITPSKAPGKEERKLHRDSP